MDERNSTKNRTQSSLARRTELKNMKPNPNPNRTPVLLLGLLVSVGLTLAPAATAKPPAPVELPSGSVDALASAIASAGPGGTVLVKTGTHTESGTIVVDLPIRIVGEPGAVIACGTAPSPLLFPIAPAYVSPTLHILDTDGVVVRGLHFVPLSVAANCAVLVHHADRAEIIGNRISGFQFGVLVHHGDNAVISDNVVECAPLWTMDPSYAFSVIGVEVLNGRYARIENNEVSGAFFAIFANDLHGRMQRNRTRWSYSGFTFCHATYGLLAIAESGEPLGADVACAEWHAQDNDSTFSFRAGYVVIDGAHDNVLNNNAASVNPVDIVLTGDGDFYGVGFWLPASHNNTVAQGSHKGLKIMDCGQNNTIAEDVMLVPCP